MSGKLGGASPGGHLRMAFAKHLVLAAFMVVLESGGDRSRDADTIEWRKPTVYAYAMKLFRDCTFRAPTFVHICGADITRKARVFMNVSWIYPSERPAPNDISMA